MKLLICYGEGLKSSGHLCLIAWPEPPEDDNQAVKPIFFDFYPADDENPQENCSIRDMTWAQFHLTRKTMDREVSSQLLESKVNFSEFKKRLANSLFRTHHTYDSTERNCVHSVLFALNAAGIKLKSKKERTCKHLLGGIFAYTKILTPGELFHDIQVYSKDKEKTKSTFKHTKLKTTPDKKEPPEINHETLNYTGLAKQLENAILLKEGCSYKHWSTGIFGLFAVSKPIYTSSSDKAYVTISSGMDQILNRLMKARKAFDTPELAYYKALEDIKKYLTEACAQNNKWYSFIFFKSGAEKRFEREWLNKLQNFVPKIERLEDLLTEIGRRFV